MAEQVGASYLRWKQNTEPWEREMATKSAGRGFFRSAFDAIVAARTAEAERYVNDALKANAALKHKRGGRFYL
jgi:hypothetical protein